MNKSNAVIGGIFILVILGALGFILTMSPSSEPATIKDTATFANPEMKVSFDYPSEWNGVTAKTDHDAVIFFDKECKDICNNLYVHVLTTAQNEYQYNNILGGEFKLPDFAAKMTPDNAALYTSAAGSTPIEKNSFLAVHGLDPTTKIPSLKIYNKKDTLYIFEIRTPSAQGGTPNFTILKNDTADLVAQSEKVFSLIVDSFTLNTESTNTQPTEQVPVIAAGTEFKFDSCGDINEFEKETFYPDFAKKVEALDLFTSPAALSDFGFRKAKMENIISACYSKEGNMFIAVVSPKEYCELGNVAKYDIAAATLTYADNSQPERESGCLSLQSFGKRNGKVIGLKALSGDAGSYSNGEFEYGYNQNILLLKKVCSGTVGQPASDCKTY